MMGAIDKNGSLGCFLRLMKPDLAPARVSLRDIAKKMGVSHVTVSTRIKAISRGEIIPSSASAATLVEGSCSMGRACRTAV